MDSKKLPPPKLDSVVPAPDLKRDEGFTVKYANHTVTEPTPWDLKVTFGRVDASAGPNAVLQHTAMSLPWPTVKCLIYLLRVQMDAYETLNGHVPFPVGGLIPPQSSLPEEFKKYPQAELVFAAMQKVWEEFVAENPEAFPQEKEGK
jgi:hypothetical protein